MNHAARMARFDESDLYVVITGAFCTGRSPEDVLAAALDAGVKLVQFREKDISDLDKFRLAERFRRSAADAGALLIVDDRVDIALAVDADGVHLGAEDLPVDAARRIAPELIIGASSHSLDEALAAQAQGASYVNIGPVFDTATKAVSTGTVGPDLITEVKPHLRIPFTTMGGIKAHNIGEVLRRGARHVAVVTAVTAADNVTQAAAGLRQAILDARAPRQ